VDCASKSDSRESDGLSGYEWMSEGYWENGKWYPIELEIGHESVTALGWPVGRMVLAHVEWENKNETKHGREVLEYGGSEQY